MNEEILDKFWYFLNERHRIFLKKKMGEKKPWTKDEIFWDYKFTNIYRELDNGTVWLRENFIEKHPLDYDILFFNICWYRMFNLISTGVRLGYQKEWDEQTAVLSLDHKYAYGAPIFTSAHMTRGLKGEPKHVSNLRVITKIWNDRHELTKDIERENTIKYASKRLGEYDLIGPFISYEIATDLRHTAILCNATDTMTWANPGPGCKRGLNRIFDYSIDDYHAIEQMKELLEMSFDKLEDHMMPLELRDIEHSLCEMSKYLKIYYGEGRTRCCYNGRY